MTPQMTATRLKSLFHSLDYHKRSLETKCSVDVLHRMARHHLHGSNNSPQSSSLVALEEPAPWVTRVVSLNPFGVFPRCWVQWLETRSPSASVRGQKAATKALGPRRTRRSGLQAELEPQNPRLESENPSEAAETGETEEVTEEDGNVDKNSDNNEDVDTEGQTEDAAAGSPAAKSVGRVVKGRAQKRRGIGIRRGARRR